jgi:hypothetical protein
MRTNGRSPFQLAMSPLLTGTSSRTNAFVVTRARRRCGALKINESRAVVLVREGGVDAQCPCK